MAETLPEGLTYTKWLGGIDFGTRNPFAAVWGFFDQSGIFWMCGEIYDRGKPLSDYFARLPRHVAWSCEPASASSDQLSAVSNRPQGATKLIAES